MKLNLLLGFLLLISCNVKETNHMSTERVISYLALGDSYTIGESVDEFERWPVQLADSLNRLGIILSFSPRG